MNAIETKNLSKIYSSAFGKKQVHALNDLNLTIKEGSIFGLLGPNGAGKTTLIKMLLGITFPSAGSAKILNEEISNYKIKSKVGYLPENHKYPSYLSGGETLKLFGKLSGLDDSILNRKIDELLELMDLSKWKKAKIKTYSKGMMQRLGLAQALLNDPDLIFLDEPTDGVDPIGRKEIRDILLELKSRSKTIFLNSHLLSEVEMITDRVAILNKGKLLREGTVHDLTVKKEEYKITVEGNGLDKISLESFDQISINKTPENSYTVRVTDSLELNKFIDLLRMNAIIIKELTPLKTTLEEMFISLINESNKEVMK
ncbi:MAG: ABC transporter ATP-binding protein [Ignavibacteriaceae bacterium]